MKRILLSLVVLNISLSADAQWFDEPIVELDTARICVMYQLTYIEDTLYPNFKQQEKQILLAGHEASSYQSFNHHKFEMIGRQKVREGQMIQWLQSGLSFDEYGYCFKYRIYKDQKHGTVTTRDYVFTVGSFKYEENKRCFDWDITSDTNTIHGYLSQKAICDFGGRRWEAWFTPEIPYSDGPYKFCGLPGLILKITDTQGHYSFNILTLKLNEHGTMVEFHDFDYIKTTKNEFNKMVYDYNKNMLNILRDMEADASVAQRASRYAASKNNPIELDRK